MLTMNTTAKTSKTTGTATTSRVAVWKPKGEDKREHTKEEKKEADNAAKNVTLTDYRHNPDDIKIYRSGRGIPRAEPGEAELPESLKNLVRELAEDDEEAAEHPFYKLRATVENQRLERLAHYAPSIETLRGSCLPPEAAEGEIEAEMFDPAILKNIYLSQEERWAWMSGDYLLREIAARIAKGVNAGVKIR
jgi:hypothetical protein